jgi:TolB protein
VSARALGLVALTACSWGGPPPPSGRLLYVSERTGAPVVHLMGVDGTGDRALTVCPGGGFPGPADPRGEAALVVCAIGEVEAEHAEQLRLVPLDGGAPIDLGPPARMVRNPTWTRDGAAVAFESDRESFRDLYRIGRDGSGLERLTDHPAGNYEPSFDPAARQIVFVSSRDGNAEVYTMGSDGTSPARRTVADGDDMRPVWSPDGQHIAFLSMRDGGKRLWLMDKDGGQQRAVLPHGAEIHEEAVWSPDSKALAVTVLHGPGQVSVDIITVDGKVERSFGAPDKVSFPDWSPDGQWLALSVDGPDGAEVVIASRSGDVRRRLTSAKGPDWLPRWLPR